MNRIPIVYEFLNTFFRKAIVNEDSISIHAYPYLVSVDWLNLAYGTMELF